MLYVGARFDPIVADAENGCPGHAIPLVWMNTGVMEKVTVALSAFPLLYDNPVIVAGADVPAMGAAGIEPGEVAPVSVTPAGSCAFQV